MLNVFEHPAGLGLAPDLQEQGCIAAAGLVARDAPGDIAIELQGFVVTGQVLQNACPEQRDKIAIRLADYRRQLVEY